VGLVTGFTETPLFQTNFFPDFTHVYFLPARVDVAPSFTHLDPVLGEAACSGEPIRASDRIATMNVRRFLIGEKYATALTVGNTSPTIAWSK
jgi:hypothetical protein